MDIDQDRKNASLRPDVACFLEGYAVAVAQIDQL
jgi:hypothetical protein